jgi:hypothetical protein
MCVCPITALAIHAACFPPEEGGAEFVSGATTASPGSIAINNHGGWSTGMHRVYMALQIRNEAAGYQHLGRIVAGLPVNEAEFAILPPFFPVMDEAIKNTIAVMYPSFTTPDLQRVGQFFVASLAYHAETLHHICNTRHVTHCSPLPSSMIWTS